MYDPEDLVGNTLAELARQPLLPMQPRSIEGGGCYVVFFKGAQDPYGSRPRKHPIYVGATERMGKRLTTHYKSLQEASNLDVEDFRCKYLLLPVGWGYRLEAVLIDKYNPWWNRPQYHGFGSGRRSAATRSKLSQWDILHPGRKFTRHLAPSSTFQVTQALSSASRPEPNGGRITDLFGQ